MNSAMTTVVLPDQGQLGDLARRLRDDATGQVRTEYCDFFRRHQDGAARRLHEPLSPADFELQGAIAEASALSQEVISLVCDALHPPVPP